MTHFICYVIGGNVEEQLAPFDESIEMPIYKERMNSENVDRMARYYSEKGFDVSADRLESLVPHLSSWRGGGGGLDDDGLFAWTTYNPQSRWDWYTIGGRWEGDLPLKTGDGASAAAIGQIDLDKLPSPAALVAEGHWQEVGHIGWFGQIDESEGELWDERVKKILESLSDDTQITLVDCHI